MLKKWGKHAAGFFKDPVRTTIEEAKRIPENIENGVTAFSNAVGEAAISGYLSFLRAQAEILGWKKLPDKLIEVLESQGHYEHINLREVRYAEGINTVHGMGITIDREIFFPCEIDILNNEDHLGWMLHELEHVTQYKVRGGVAPFLVQYGLTAALEALKHGSFNIHDNIGIEKEATDKANRITDDVWHAVRSSLRLGPG